MKALIPALLAALVLVSPAQAVEPSEMLPDAKQEMRAQELGRELRCLVCQNESIEDSNADLAKDLRIIVREQISSGKTDEDVRKFVVDRYGDYVLLKPPFKAQTLVLWVGPFVMLALGILAYVVFFRRRQTTAQPALNPLSDEEKRRLEALLKDGK